MLLFPHAKINLGLYVTGKRSDGYHEIETLFYPVGLHDLLEFITDHQIEHDILTTSGIPIPGQSNDNLLLKACRLFRSQYDLPPVRIHLHKMIPMGAGLGGGSSDAAFLINGLNQYYQQKLSLHELSELALALGSDCPYFLSKGPAIGRGRGELLSPVKLDLSDYYLVLLHPAIHVSTQQAYQNVLLTGQPDLSQLLIDRDVRSWRGRLRNDFESSVFDRYPMISQIKDQLYALGSLYASMSGSGSAVFGIFSEPVKLPDDLQKWKIWEGRL